MDRYEAHLGTIFQKLHFANKDDNIEILADNILQAKRQFQSPFKEEITPVLLADYVRELWISESPPQMDIDTVAVVDVLVDGGDIEQSDLNDHTKKKLFNIYRAIHYVISDDSAGADPLTEDFIKKIHTVLAADNVIRDGGHYRTQIVGASGSRVMYCVPRLIEERLRTLLEFIRRKRDEAPQNDVDRLLYMLRVGTLLLSEFLLIHPFRNGNGRTARILLNAVLKPEVGVPFSLYVLSRDQYIEALEARNDLSPPSKLASYLLRACNKTSALLNWLTS